MANISGYYLSTNMNLKLGQSVNVPCQQEGLQLQKTKRQWLWQITSVEHNK